MFPPTSSAESFFCHFLFPLLIKLPGIDHIMPYAIKTGRHSCNRSKESISHPNGKNRIFLSQSLPGTDSIIIMASDLAPQPELQGTAYQ